MTRVILADDHRIFRQGLRVLLEAQHEVEVVGEAGDGDEAVRLVRELAPDLVVMDLSMPGMSGLEATRTITGEYPATRVVVLSIHADRRFVSAALGAGAAGYLLKNCAFGDLAEAIRTSSRRRPFLSPQLSAAGVRATSAEMPGRLTPREQEVLLLLTEGSSTREVSENLEISIKTAETHRANILRKVGVRNVPELVKYAIREGLTDP